MALALKTLDGLHRGSKEVPEKKSRLAYLGTSRGRSYV
uniref:Uncharacterized protein n=1 Tax=Chloracidobacterium thermophilum TaxID=458033 RepID=A8DJS9_9BACT|nr:hypothetical protein YS_M60-F11.172 [Chloracidobacterium thermophilum]